MQFTRDNGEPTPVTVTFNVLDLSASFTMRIDSAGVSSGDCHAQRRQHFQALSVPPAGR
jgi:hypothetical protein